jgi:energy-coupling factor transporter ATP-binding protein EcfA2
MTGAAVTLRGATLRYGHHVIWDGLDLDVAPGECLAVLGPNGAGKTTLLKVLLGLIPLSAGTVTIDGRPPRRGSPVTGYVPQQRDFDRDLPIRGRDLVQFGVTGTAGACCSPAPARSAPPSRRSARRITPTRRSGCCPAGSSSGCGSPRRWPDGRGCCCATSRCCPSTRPPSTRSRRC